MEITAFAPAPEPAAVFLFREFSQCAKSGNAAHRRDGSFCESFPPGSFRRHRLCRNSILKALEGLYKRAAMP